MSNEDDNIDMDMEEIDMEDEEMEGGQAPKGQKLEGEQFDCDLEAYNLFHAGSTGAPCLSFDILKDNLGNNRSCDRSVSCYFVAGTQGARTHANSIILMKMRNLKPVKTKDVDDDDVDEDDEDEELEDSEDEEGPDPIVSSAMLQHDGCVNRIRATQVNNVKLAAAWSELGVVNIWDLSHMLEAVEDDSQRLKINDRPLFGFKGHKGEGFAIDWSPTKPGTLATGDCVNKIHVWEPSEGGLWVVDARPYTAHTASVEDIQWSPNEPNVFASCSVDKSIRIWDCRAKPDAACMLTAANTHDSDVNVINWNKNEPFIVSGGDDGKVKVWDLRQMPKSDPVAVLKYHEAPVTTVEWHPIDASVLATGGEDNQILQWDLAVERDPDENDEQEDENVPQQLLFIHRGQHEVKELHWHPQVPGMIISTAHSGFNIFKTISC